MDTIQIEILGRGIKINFEGLLLCGDKYLEVFKKSRYDHNKLLRKHEHPNTYKCVVVKMISEKFILGFPKIGIKLLFINFCCKYIHKIIINFLDSPIIFKLNDNQQIEYVRKLEITNACPYSFDFINSDSSFKFLTIYKKNHKNFRMENKREIILFGSKGITSTFGHDFDVTSIFLQKENNLLFSGDNKGNVIKWAIKEKESNIDEYEICKSEICTINVTDKFIIVFNKNKELIFYNFKYKAKWNTFHLDREIKFIVFNENSYKYFLIGDTSKHIYSIEHSKLKETETNQKKGNNQIENSEVNKLK
jgi:WD40 repeat protein